jgi:hypothetical protein
MAGISIAAYSARLTQSFGVILAFSNRKPPLPALLILARAVPRERHSMINVENHLGPTDPERYGAPRLAVRYEPIATAY